MVEASRHQLASFLDYLRYERQNSPRTIDAYQNDLNRLCAYCDQQQVKNWNDLDSIACRKWLASLHQYGLSASSIQRMLSASRSFYRWLIREQHASMNPFELLKAPRRPRKLPGTLDIDTVQQLLDVRSDDPLAVRDHAIMELFYSSGLRLSELVSLNLGDIDLAGGELRVTGKGNKTRLLPVGRYAVKAIEAWLMIRQGLANEDEKALFVSKQGKRLAARSVEKRLRGWAVKQGLGRNLHPHMLRHSFASHMLESSGDLRAVQELLGHQNISTTQIYTHLDFQHLARVFDDAHPRARRKKTSS